MDASSYGRRAIYRRRKQIPKRLAHALLEIPLLTSHLPDDLRKDAFETLHEKTGNDFILTASAPIALTYVGLTDLVTDPTYYPSLKPDEAADTVLAFRNALSHGIKTGKRNHKHASQPPETVLIDANTQLYEYPEITASDLPQELYRKYGKGVLDRDGTKLIENTNSHQNSPLAT